MRFESFFENAYLLLLWIVTEKLYLDCLFQSLLKNCPARTRYDYE